MCNGLDVEQAHLDSRGVRDIKVFLDPTVAKTITREELCTEMVHLLKTYRLGEHKKLELVGDKLLKHR